MKVAYIAGPYRAKTVAGIVANIRAAEAVAIEYWQKGYAVICPHKNTALFDGLADDSVWLAGMLEILKRCDVLVMTGKWHESSGSLAELDCAIELELKIHYHQTEGKEPSDA